MNLLSRIWVIVYSSWLLQRVDILNSAYNLTALEVEMKSATSVEEIHLNIVDSKFLVPRKYGSMRANGVAMTQGWGVNANVHTKLEGNTFGPSD